MTDEQGRQPGSRPALRTRATGVEGVRVEVLAKNLGVTKGGFYRRFRDRAALLDGHAAELERRGASPRSRSRPASTARPRASG